jgi:hypothetical protein
VHDRHLRPDEIDLLLDGEDGFGVAPLRAHVRSCLVCHGELERSRELMNVLDTMPDFAPSPGFSDRVMSQVQVFEPWHAAAMSTARQFIPASRPARVAAGVGAAVGAGVLTAGTTWAIARADIGILLAQVGLERLHVRVSEALSDLSTALVGQSGIELVNSGSPEMMALMAGSFVAAVGLGVVGLRSLVTVSRRGAVSAGRNG